MILRFNRTISVGIFTRDNLTTQQKAMSLSGVMISTYIY